MPKAMTTGRQQGWAGKCGQQLSRKKDPCPRKEQLDSTFRSGRKPWQEPKDAEPRLRDLTPQSPFPSPAPNLASPGGGGEAHSH